MSIRERFARQRYLVDYTLATMWRRRGRNLMLLFVMALVVFLVASVLLFGAALRQHAASALRHAPEITVQNLRMGRHALAPPRWVERLRAIRGVHQVRGRLWGYFYDRATGANYTVMVPPDSAAFLLKPGETIVGDTIRRMRDERNLGYLFLLSPTGRLFKLRIRESLPPETGLFSADLVLMARADFLRFFGLAGDEGYTDITLRVRNPNEVDKVVEKISAALPAARVITRADILRTYENVFSWRQGVVLSMLLAALVAFAILAFDKASGLSAEERREIGILKALGWSTADIMAVKFWEGALVALPAFLFGLAAAWAHVFLFGAGVLAPVLRGWSVLQPPLSLVPALEVMQVVILAFITIVPFIAATIVPVWKAAITDPDMVMR